MLTIRGVSVTQMSRLVDHQDVFSIDRLIDAATRIGLSVRITATRPCRGASGAVAGWASRLAWSQAAPVEGNAL